MDDLIMLLGLSDLACADDAARILKNQKDEIERLQKCVAELTTERDVADKIERLQSRITELEKTCVAHVGNIEKLAVERDMLIHGNMLYGDEFERLQKRVAELMKDASRYLYLRDSAYGTFGHLALLPPKEMDSAVDAGMRNAIIKES